MLLTLKMCIYVVIISVLSFFGAVFVGTYIVIEKVFFPVYISMKMHKLKSDGDVLNSVEKRSKKYIFMQ